MDSSLLARIAFASALVVSGACVMDNPGFSGPAEGDADDLVDADDTDGEGGDSKGTTSGSSSSSGGDGDGDDPGDGDGDDPGDGDGDNPGDGDGDNPGDGDGDNPGDGDGDNPGDGEGDDTGEPEDPCWGLSQNICSSDAVCKAISGSLSDAEGCLVPSNYIGCASAMACIPTQSGYWCDVELGGVPVHQHGYACALGPSLVPCNVIPPICE
jgi:hypothetical protein